MSCLLGKHLDKQTERCKFNFSVIIDACLQPSDNYCVTKFKNFEHILFNLS